jgi:hypothetical protein
MMGAVFWTHDHFPKIHTNCTRKQRWLTESQ